MYSYAVHRFPSFLLLSLISITLLLFFQRMPHRSEKGKSSGRFSGEKNPARTYFFLNTFFRLKRRQVFQYFKNEYPRHLLKEA
jgi:hypothetical protein